MTRFASLVGVLVSAGCVPVDQPPADAPAEPTGLARLQDRGRPTPGPVGALWAVSGTVTAVDGTSVTLRGRFGAGADNAKEEDDSGSNRFGRWVRRDKTKPIVLRYPGWELDCDSYRLTPAGMVVTLLTGEQITLPDKDQPIRRFPAAKTLLNGEPHPRIQGRKHCHLLQDVRVGDLVDVHLFGSLSKEECVEVTILRRPGSRVPHSNPHPEFFREMIERYNAYQDYEERGIPIPDRFRRDLIRMREEAFLRGEEVPPPPKQP